VSDNKADGGDVVEGPVENQPIDRPSVATPSGAAASNDTPSANSAGAGSPRETVVAGAPAAPGRGAAEPPAAADPPPVTLGNYLAAIRERRGVSREQMAGESHIPAHYVRMIESSDYSMIADQLYMVPFIRRYAAFLDLDPEEIAMRFVREVQRADSVPQPRLDQPLNADVRKRGGRRGGLLVVAALLIVAGLYFYQSERHRQAAESYGLRPATAGDSSSNAIAPGQPPPAIPAARAS
jgi:transcriptional regulator with XRE-family HTH domain